MKNLITLALVSGCLILPPVAAEIYKWTDENGRVHYGDRPKNQAKTVEIDNHPNLKPENKDWQEIQQRQKKYLDYLKDERGDRDENRQQTAEKKAQREQACAEARDYHNELITKRLLYELDEDGNKVFLSHEEKDKEIAKTEAAIKKYCRD